MLITKKGIQVTRDIFVKHLKRIATAGNIEFPSIDKNSPLLHNFYQEAYNSYKELIKYYDNINNIKINNEEEWTKDDGKGLIRYNTFKEMIEDE